MSDEIAPITLTTLYEMMVDLTRMIELILSEYPSSSRGDPRVVMTFRDYNSILEYCLCYPSFCMMYSLVIPFDAFSFMGICLCFVIWCVVLLTWGISSLAHCGLEVWPIMEDIEPISPGSEIWPREFETVDYYQKVLFCRPNYNGFKHLCVVIIFI